MPAPPANEADERLDYLKVLAADIAAYSYDKTATDAALEVDYWLDCNDSKLPSWFGEYYLNLLIDLVIAERNQ